MRQRHGLLGRFERGWIVDDVGVTVGKVVVVRLRSGRRGLFDRCGKLFGMGCMSRNEVRTEIGMDALPPEEEGDKYYIASTYVPVADAGTNAAAMGKETRIDELAAKVDGLLAGENSKKGGPSANLDLHDDAAADAGD